VGAIVGATIGGLAVIGGAIFALILIRRRPQRILHSENGGLVEDEPGQDHVEARNTPDVGQINASVSALLKEKHIHIC
jgi:hypothetical protein